MTKEIVFIIFFILWSIGFYFHKVKESDFLLRWWHWIREFFTSWEFANGLFMTNLLIVAFLSWLYHGCP